MDRSEVNLNRWVESRLSVLDAGTAWRPDTSRALARLKNRQVKRVRYMAASWVAAVAAGLCLLLLVQQPACASPVCAPFVKRAAAPQSKTAAAPAAKASTSAVPAPAPLTNNYKESGSPAARVSVEIYSDYECPMCATLHHDVMPLLMSQYVQTGKVKLIHRDFPLPQHTHSRLAARYVNAAGGLGYYDVAGAQVFKTQNIWNKDGDIDRQLAQVLAPGVMQKVRELVKSDATLEETVTRDVAAGRQDQITGTPTWVVVANGKRQNLPAMPSFNLVRAYLDQLLASAK